MGSLAFSFRVTNPNLGTTYSPSRTRWPQRSSGSGSPGPHWSKVLHLGQWRYITVSLAELHPGGGRGEKGSLIGVKVLHVGAYESQPRLSRVKHMALPSLIEQINGCLAPLNQHQVGHHTGQ